MNRRSFLYQSALASSLPMLSRPAWFSSLFAAYEMRALRGNVGVFTESGGTIAWYVTGKHIVVVDTQFPDPAAHVIAEIKKMQDHPFDLLINTHHHGDHTSGNITFKGLAPKLVAHENSKANQQRVAEDRGNMDQQWLPTETFSTAWETQMGDEFIQLHYFGPAHTDGDAMIHFTEANVVHMGDLVFNRRFPYIDKSAGASISNWIQVLDNALNTFDRNTLFVFGHSGEGYDITGDAEDLQAMQNYLSSLLNFMEKEIAAGKSKEEIANATQIPGAPEWKGDGIGRSIDAAWIELVEKK